MNEGEKKNRVIDLEHRIRLGASFLEFRNSEVYKAFDAMWKNSASGLDDVETFQFGSNFPSIESQVLGRKFAKGYIAMNQAFIQQMIDDGRFAEAELKKIQSEVAIMGETQSPEVGTSG